MGLQCGGRDAQGLGAKGWTLSVWCPEEVGPRGSGRPGLPARRGLCRAGLLAWREASAAQSGTQGWEQWAGDQMAGTQPPAPGTALQSRTQLCRDGEDMPGIGCCLLSSPQPMGSAKGPRPHPRCWQAVPCGSVDFSITQAIPTPKLPGGPSTGVGVAEDRDEQVPP